MRILAGHAKGRAIKRPSHIRLTSEKVKGAVFNILGEAARGARFLDVCAGSGSVGLEAWSRGAAAVTWIERDAACAKILRANIAQLAGASPPASLQVICHDAPTALRRLAIRGAPFDLIFIDPPYDDISLLKKTLQVLGGDAILTDAGWIVVEHARRLALSQLIDNIEIVNEYRYGDTVLTLCRVSGASGESDAAR